jgi:hypothetical protein
MGELRHGVEGYYRAWVCGCQALAEDWPLTCCDLSSESGLILSPAIPVDFRHNPH